MIKNMKLKLYITKNYNAKDYNKPAYIRFAVIDHDISKKYPANFVCMLPKTIKPNAKVQNKFVKKYGNKSQELSKKLLKQALKTTEDQDIKKEIRERIKLLNPKPKNLVKCNVCGEEFKARKYGYRRQKNLLWLPKQRTF
jgi:formylmethanofuran dehydrogenase subunit E